MILMFLLSLGTMLGWGLLGTWAQTLDISLSEPLREVWSAEAEDNSRDSFRRNLCPYQKSRLVTFVTACKTEKFFVHSQQPCPQGVLDCQKVKVMYRVAHKPVYQVQQKVMTSVAWRCCPGFTGPDCQLHDPAAVPEPVDANDDFLEPWDRPVSMRFERQAPELSLDLEDVQNDHDQEEESSPTSWESLEGNITALATERTESNQTEASQMEFGVPERPLEQALMQRMDSFLQEHLSPLWRNFNQSLHSLSQAIRNLSREVEANQQAIRQLQESAVAKADVQELGVKFETKLQETAQKMNQLQEDVEDRLHAQYLSLQMSLSETQTEVDVKLKKALKAQEQQPNNSLLLAAAAAGARPEPESLQARMGQLQRNLSALLVDTTQREQELQGTLADMKASLAQHGDEIKELYSESDETFDQLSKVEQLVNELQVNHTALRELRIILMEKSLIMEENKEELERQILELNITLQQVQGGHSDLIRYVKDCNCQKLSFDMDVLREDQKDTTRVLEETQVSLDERQHQLEGSSLQALSSTVDTLSRAIAVQQEDSERAQEDLARLRTGLQALGREVNALQTAEEQTRKQISVLHSSFTALLADALRHEAVLAALFGEEVMEEMSEEVPGPLPLRYDQIRVALQEAATGLQEQSIGWDTLAARVTVLEQAARDRSGSKQPLLSTELQEPSHDASPDEEASGQVLAGLTQEIQRLSTDIKRMSLCCEASGVASINSSFQGLRQALSTTQHGLEQYQLLFHSLFGNFQGLLEANVSLDLGKLQSMLNKKEKRQKKGLEAPRRRDKKQVEPLVDVPGTELWEAGSSVAFYASFSKGTTALQPVKFNIMYINRGSSYFSENGYFRAPERGVYLFAVSVEFGPGPGTGQLVLGGHHHIPLYSTGESTVMTFAMAELQKGERVWFELTQGSILKKSPSSTAFGGFLMFKT